MSRLVALATWLVALVARRRESSAGDVWMPDESWELDESTLEGFLQVCGQLGASEPQREEFRQGFVAEERNLRGMRATLEVGAVPIRWVPIRQPRTRRPRRRVAVARARARAPARPDDEGDLADLGAAA